MTSEVSGPGAAQERRRLKRALAGADSEVLRIEHDAREHCLRLHAQDVRLLDQLLEQLRHQLAGRRRIRLVEAHGRIGDIGRRAPVVVDDRHTGAGFQQVVVLDLVRAVGVHHDEQCAAVGVQVRLLRRQKRLGYSGTCSIRSRSWPAAVLFASMTMRQGVPSLRAMQQTPAAAPSVSRSENLWPMT